MPATGDSDRADLTTPSFFSGMSGDELALGRIRPEWVAMTTIINPRKSPVIKPDKVRLPW
jgi:hypothetical protein